MPREPIDLDELNVFHDKVQKMADKEFGQFDADEGSWLEVHLVDRTRYYAPPFEPMPHSSLKLQATDEADFDRLSIAMFNQGVAASELEIAWKLYIHTRFYMPCPECRHGWVHKMIGGKLVTKECPRCKGKCEVLRKEQEAI